MRSRGPGTEPVNFNIPMLIAKQRRKENMAEYILYLWQLEDMLRALSFSPEATYAALVAPHAGMDEPARRQLLDWYLDLGHLLETEGKHEGGHLDHTLHLIGELDELHRHLLRAPGPKAREYAAAFEPLARVLPRLKEKMEPGVSDVEACFRALYSVVLCRLSETAREAVRAQEAISGATETTATGERFEPGPVGGCVSQQYIDDVLELVSPVIARLSAIYLAAERGEVDLYEGME